MVCVVIGRITPELGHVITLFNLNGDECRCARLTTNLRTLEVLHTNGFHRASYPLCHCDQLLLQPITPERLLTNGLFPATENQPQRAFTFEVLKEFDYLNIYGYVNVKQFLDSKLKSQDEKVSETYHGIIK